MRSSRLAYSPKQLHVKTRRTAQETIDYLKAMGLPVPESLYIAAYDDACRAACDDAALDRGTLRPTAKIIPQV